MDMKTAIKKYGKFIWNTEKSNNQQISKSIALNLEFHIKALYTFKYKYKYTQRLIKD